jgi:hypothetical protein
MRLISAVLLLLLCLSSASAQDFTDEQRDLITDVRTAYENRLEWDTYRESTQETVLWAYTVNGSWQTQNSLREIVLAVDREDRAAAGTATYTVSVASSEGMADEERTADFIIVDDTLFVATDGDDFIADTPDPVFNLPTPDALDYSLSPEEVETLLENLTAIFDLGVDDGVQGYELHFDFINSLPVLDFDLNEFAAPFTGVVEADELITAIAENGSVRALVYVEIETEQVVALSLLIDIPLDFESASIEYGYQMNALYYDVNEPLSIEAP